MADEETMIEAGVAPMAELDEACRMLAYALDYVEKANPAFGVRIYEFLATQERNPNTGERCEPCPRCGKPYYPSVGSHRSVTECPVQ